MGPAKRAPFSGSTRGSSTLSGLPWQRWLPTLLLLLASAAILGAQTVGYVKDVRGAYVLLNLGSDDGVHQGQEFSVLQYEKEIARARVTEVRRRESLALVTLLKPGTVIRKLDEVVPAGPSGPSPQPTSETPPPSTTTPPGTPGPGPGKPTLEPVEPPAGMAPSFSPAARRPPGGWMDLVPLAGWTYSALSLLASEGLLPGFPAREFHGDQLFTRHEVAELVLRVLQARDHGPQPLTPRAALMLELLARRYQREINYLIGRPPKEELPLPSQPPGLVVGGYLRPRLHLGDGQSLLPLFQTSAFLNLGGGLVVAAAVTNQHREWQGRDAGRVYPYLDRLLLTGKVAGFDVTLGKDYVRYGPGYTGSLMWGEDSPAIPMIRVERELKLPLLGRWSFQQMSGTYREDGDRKYVGLRSLQRHFGKRFTFGWSESYKSDRAVNPSIGFLPYLAYQEIFSSGVKGINRINIQEGLDFGYHTRGLEVYSEVFIDDMTAPRAIGSQGPVPRKLGWMLGARLPHLLGDRHTDLRLEWVSTDRNTYLHRSPSVSLFQKGLPLGHPIGPNSHSLFLRANRRLGDRLEVTASYQAIRQAGAGVPFVPSLDQFALSGAYDLGPDRSVALRIAPRRTRGIAGRHTETQLQLVADYSF